MTVTTDFCSSATGKVLASELPKNGNMKCTVLYPASAKAGGDIGMCNGSGFMLVAIKVGILLFFQFVLLLIYDRTYYCLIYYFNLVVYTICMSSEIFCIIARFAQGDRKVMLTTAQSAHRQNTDASACDLKIPSRVNMTYWKNIK